jgi:membrane protein required for colicin V production
MAVALGDWLLLGVLVLSMALGLWRGLVYEVMSVLGWVASFVLAQLYATAAAAELPLGTMSEPLRYAAGFAAVFVASAFAGGLLAFITKKLIEAVGLRPVDRMLGAAFGFVRGMVLLLALAVLAALTPLHSAALWQESWGAAVLTTALKGLKPVLPEDFGKYLP